MVTTTHPSTEQPSRSRKVRALLAGGLVLGLGGAVTLAAWNDSEFATGLFASSQFNLEGSTTGATEGYEDHATSGAAADLQFSVPVADLSPGDVVAAPFWVRLDATTTAPGSLDLVALETTDSAGTNSEQLSYEVHALAADATCDADASGTVVATGATLVSNPDVAGETVPLAVGADTAAGEAVHLCFVVTAGDGLVQGGSTTAVWQLSATSDSE